MVIVTSLTKPGTPVPALVPVLVAVPVPVPVLVPVAVLVLVPGARPVRRG